MSARPGLAQREVNDATRDGARIGGYEDLRRYLGPKVRDPKAASYRPVIALFAMTALMALAMAWVVYGVVFEARRPGGFIALRMCVLAMLKLQDVATFSTMFPGYDLLARRAHVPGLVRWTGSSGQRRTRAPVRYPRGARKSQRYLIGIIRCWYGVPAHIT